MKRMAEMRSGRAAGSSAYGGSAQAGAGGAPPRLSESIESRENRWLKRFRAALAGDSIAELGASGASGASADHRNEIVGVEGARLVETALRSGVEILAVLFSEAGAKHLPRLGPFIPTEARLLRTTDRLFSGASGTETPQGIAALVRPRTAAFEDLVGGDPLVLVLAGVQDPGNVGTLVRTAEAFGASGIAACSDGAMGTANPFAPKALRASAGAGLRLPILRGPSAPVLLAQLKVAGVRTYAACPEEIAEGGGTSGDAAKKALAPWEIDWRKPSALLVGNEGGGLPANVARSADAVVTIPYGLGRNRAQKDSAAESLNAAIAGSILLYEAARQRGLG